MQVEAGTNFLDKRRVALLRGVFVYTHPSTRYGG
jgi:hypothetical protein